LLPGGRQGIPVTCITAAVRCRHRRRLPGWPIGSPCPVSPALHLSGDLRRHARADS